jgi:hypothetical protein
MVWVVVLALGVIAPLMVVLSRAPAPPPLPSPNGYDDLLKASAAAGTNGYSYGLVSNAALRKLVSSNAQALRLVRLGLTRQCAVPSAAAMTNNAALLNDLAGMKGLALLLMAESRVHLEDNQPAAAAACCLDAMRLGNEISRRGILLHRRVGIACEAIARYDLVKFVTTLSPAEARPVIATLQEIDRTRVSFDDVMRQERSSFYRQLRANGNPVLWVRALWDFRATRQMALAHHKVIVAYNHLVATELALRCYRADKSCVPARLEDLVPDYLRRVPEDPFLGRPLIYRPEGTNWLLYSVGPDGVDDGGRPGRYWNSSPGDLPYNGP